MELNKTMSRKIIKKFNGSYGRVGVIWIDNVICDLCNNKKPCVISDGSESEYRYASICSDCAIIECKKWIANQPLDSKTKMVNSVKKEAKRFSR